MGVIFSLALYFLSKRMARNIVHKQQIAVMKMSSTFTPLASFVKKDTRDKDKLNAIAMINSEMMTKNMISPLLQR